MTDSLNAVADIAFRSGIVYLVILVGFRIAGKRHISQLSLIDFALILLVSNAVQNAMVGSDTTLTGGITAAATLIAMNLVLTKILYRRENLARLLTGEPRLLIRNGRFVMSNLIHEDIRVEEVEQQIREHGFDNVTDVRTAILELDGSISVIPYDREGKHIEHHMPFVRQRRPARRGFKPG